MFDQLHAILVPDIATAGTIIAIPMFIAGLAGGFTHCAGMCGPFVFAQVAGRLSHVDVEAFGTLARVRVAATLPYHLGRLTTYSLLGVAAGGISDSLKAMTQYAWIPPAFMLVSAMLFLAQAVDHPFRLPWLDEKLSRGAGAIMQLFQTTAKGGAGLDGYLLGIALGFLPCGMLYGALAASAGCGTWMAGGVGMGAFAIGTFPALFVVGYGGVALGKFRRAQLRKLARPAMALNSAILVGLAARSFLT